MLLLDFINKECVKVPLESTDKDGVIVEMIDLLVANGDIDDRDGALQVVMDREALMSTGIGNGVAIPHGKTEGVSHIVGAIGITAGPLEFDSVDKEPVRLVILMVSSAAETGPHIRALSRISRLLADETFRQRLIDAPTADDVVEIVRSEEERRK
jgi:fructose-specific phosphotransferase system IIA component